MGASCAGSVDAGASTRSIGTLIPIRCDCPYSVRNNPLWPNPARHGKLGPLSDCRSIPIRTLRNKSATGSGPVAGHSHCCRLMTIRCERRAHTGPRLSRLRGCPSAPGRRRYESIGAVSRCPDFREWDGGSLWPVAPRPPFGIDTTVPSTARMYDWWLRGHDNFAADRRPSWQ
jgi:hypothetical protein